MTQAPRPQAAPDHALGATRSPTPGRGDNANALAMLTRSTRLLDLDHPAIQQLIAERHWRHLALFERIGAVYTFVRDDIAFGYNASDDLPASRVLAEGQGQCNTKGTLLMALLRAVDVPCRLHGFTIDKALQRGAITGIAYLFAPRHILHSWVEIWFDGRWIELEGFILDRPYLHALQTRFSEQTGPFCGYGAATPDLKSPPVDWQGQDTYIQRDGIDHDFGVFNSPDDFYARHGTNLTGLKRWLFLRWIRERTNRQVAAIRAGRSSRRR